MTRLMLAFAIFCGMTLPARANDTALKTEIEQLGASYMECYSKKDAACIAAHYTPEGIHVNQSPVQKPVEVYTNGFAAGFNKLDAKVVSASALGADSVIANGTYHVTGKDKDGKDLDARGKWSGVYVRQDGKLKIRMLTAVPNPPAK